MLVAEVSGAKASIAGENLRGVNLSGAKLDNADASNAVVDRTTRIPNASFKNANLVGVRIELPEGVESAIFYRTEVTREAKNATIEEIQRRLSIKLDYYQTNSMFTVKDLRRQRHGYKRD